MTNDTTQLSASDVAPATSTALAALAWAEQIATEAPQLLDSPPAFPSEAEIRAIALGDLRGHLDRLIVGNHVEEGLEALQRAGIVAIWMPEVERMVGMGDSEWRHKDVWKHTKQVVNQAVPRLTVRWGALLHDIGKPRTRRITDGGQVTFYGHAELGAAMFRKRMAKRLGFEGELRERIHFLILFHLRASQYATSWTDSAVRRFYKQMGPGLRDLLDLSRADITTKRPERRKRGVRQVSLLGQRIRALQEQDDKTPPLPKGLGNAMMSELGVPPSKRLGDIIKALTADIDAGDLDPGQEAEHYIAYLREHHERFGV